MFGYMQDICKKHVACEGCQFTGGVGLQYGDDVYKCVNGMNKPPNVKTEEKNV